MWYYATYCDYCKKEIESSIKILSKYNFCYDEDNPEESSTLLQRWYNKEHYCNKCQSLMESIERKKLITKTKTYL